MYHLRDEDLARCVQKILDIIKNAKNKNVFKNCLDPFGAFFDSLAAGGIGYDKWLQVEQARQGQKSLQNAIGDFHQEIMGYVQDCQSNPPGEGADILNKSGSWCAELKNKFSTTKGNHRGAVHEDIERWVIHYEQKYGREFTGYYCYVIPKKPNDVDKIWDFTEKGIRYQNKKIREITYAKLLDEATGVEDSLRKLYLCLPTLLENEFGTTSGLEAKHMEMLFKKNIR
jgi:hypothetical protein